MKYILSFFISFVLCTTIISAQSGKITGKVYDSQTGNPLASATIKLIETGKSTSSDVNGFFSFSKLANKEYSISVNYVSYEAKTIKVTVANGAVSNVDIVLEKGSAKLSDVTIKSRKINKESASALLVLQKNRNSISDGISAEVIRKTPDRSASDVMKRISGASIQEDKFAIIRGLNDRYNATLINGSPAPSSESDRKAFAFDVFSANLLDNLVIAKTATPDMPSDFAGGIIMVNTKSLPDQNFQTISIGTGLNDITTFKDRIKYAGGQSNMLSDKDISGSLPDKANFPSNFKAQEKLAQMFKNNWALSTGTFAPNYNLQYTIGRNFQRRGKDFAGFILSATYSNTNTFFDIQRKNFATSITDPNEPSIVMDSYTNTIYSSRTLGGVLANFSVKIDPSNIINFRNIYSINNDNRLVYRTGERDINPLDNSGVLIRQNARVYLSNQFLSSQLDGQHYFPEDKIKINWLAYFSDIKRRNPSRNDTYVYDANTQSYIAQIGDGANDNDAGTTKTIDTNEKIKGFQLDASMPIEISENFTNVFKVGGAYTIRERDFNARRLGFAPSSNFNYDIIFNSIDSLFDPKNLGPNGFRLVDRTAPFDKYDGKVKTLASYAMFDTRLFKRLRLIGGVRSESFQMNLNSVNLDFITPLRYRSNVNSILPSFNLVYSINEKQNIRFSYSKTLNRPEFREISPFLFYDYSTGFTVTGNDTLQTSQINNFDVRYEIYPGRGQVFSISGFHKKFKGPIEQVYQLNAVNPNINYQNSPDANLTGIETEVRMVLGAILNSKMSLLNNLTFMANYSWIQSKVVIPFSADYKVERPLQGQSPYLINSGMIYNDEKSGWGASVFVNRTGARIFIAGNNVYPDVWESGRTVCDVQISKSLIKKKLDIRLNAKDFLAPNLNFFEDRNGNKKFDGEIDNLVQSNNFGKVFSINLTYKL